MSDFNAVPASKPTTVIVNSWTLSFSRAGETGWVSHVITPTSSCGFAFDTNHLAGAGFVAGVANVDGVAGEDLVLWGAKDGNNFCLVSGGTGTAQRQSSQDMRQGERPQRCANASSLSPSGEYSGASRTEATRAG
jgi:hypothetical protein